MTFYFYSDNSGAYEGFDLTVELFNPTEKRVITINPAENGSLESNKTEAMVEEVITLTATPNSDYVLSGLSVKDAKDNDVAVVWITYINTATFIMPASAVSVTPTFTEATGDAPFINMPTTGTKTITIPEGLMSLKVYDDGGKDGNLTPNCYGYLVLTAPEGYNLKVSGTINAGGTNTSDRVEVYDGGDKTAPKLIDNAQSSSWYHATEIPTVTSTGQSIMILFVAYFDNCKGLDLTVELVSTSTEYGITVHNPDKGGTVTPDVDAAVVNQTVTLTASPDEGNVVTDLVVTDINNNILAVTDMKWYTSTNTATFRMPASPVSVTPSFSDDLTSLFIEMPKTGTKNAIIPESVTSFKVYDNGGSEERYTFSCDGTLVMTAPAGYRLQLSGNIMTSQEDYLTVYDGNSASGTKLLDAAKSDDYYEWTPIATVTSTGESMTLYFYSDDSAGITDGLDLTVTLLPTLAEALASGSDGDNVTLSDALAVVQKTEDGDLAYVTDGNDHWARLEGDAVAGLNVGDGITGVSGTLANMGKAPTIVLAAAPAEAIAPDYQIATIDLQHKVTDLPSPCQVVSVSGFYDGLKLRAYRSAPQGQGLLVNADHTSVAMKVGKRYDVVAAIELLEPWDNNEASGAPRRVSPTDDNFLDNIYLMVVSGDENPETGIDDLATDNGKEVEAIYTVDGIRVDSVAKGVNIIRFKDGSVKKVLF